MPPIAEHEELIRIIQAALTNASTAFSALIETACRPTGSAVVMRSVGELPNLLGDMANPVTGILLTVHEDLSGFLLVMVPGEFVGPLAERLIGIDCVDCDLVDSALGEVGNVVGSAFLNSLADSFGLTVLPTPPQVVHDMAGALLSTLAVYQAMEGHDEFPVIQTGFVSEGIAFEAYLLWLPGELQVLEGRA